MAPRSSRPSFSGQSRVDVDQNGVIWAKTSPMFAKELRKAVVEIASEARTIVRQRHEGPSKRIVNRRVVNVPSSGNLRRSIQPYAGRAAAVVPTGPTSIGASVTAGSRKAPYAKFVHDGTKAHRISASPGRMLSFYGAGRMGRKTFKRRSLRQLNDDEWATMEAGSRVSDALAGEYNEAVFRHNRRVTDITAGRRTRLRTRDADVITTISEHNYAGRRVIVSSVNHPGNRRSGFIAQAAVKVVKTRYGGAINLPRGVPRA